MFKKVVLLLFLAAGVLGFEDNPLSHGLNYLPEIDGYLFENNIKEFLEKVRVILKNGDPEQGIPPLEPLPIPFFDFDFILEDSRLEGYIDEILAHNISDFIVTDVEFNPLGITLKLGLRFENLTIDGNYKLLGNIFEEAINAEGAFVSVTNTLDLDVLLHVGSNLDHSQIKELVVNFSFTNDSIQFTNKLTNTANGQLDNSYLQPLTYRIRDQYFPLLANTLKLVGSDLIHDITLEEIVQFILDLIQGKPTELIKTNLSENLRKNLAKQ